MKYQSGASLLVSEQTSKWRCYKQQRNRKLLVQSLKRFIQALLQKIHLYQRLKESWLYDLFWRVADRRLIEERDREVEFYRSVLAGFRKNDLIFDIGANNGSKTSTFLRLGARVVAVDPDESNQRVLRERFLSCRVFKKPVSIIGKALSERKGVETFWIEEPGSGKNTLNQKWVETLRQDEARFGERFAFRQKKAVPTITLDDLISTYGSPFFIKIDVEGHEEKVLRGLRHPVPYLSFEVNLPEFRLEGLKCIELLNRLMPEARFNYVIESRSEIASPQWLDSRELSGVLENCPEKSIEIYCRDRIAHPAASNGFRPV